MTPEAQLQYVYAVVAAHHPSARTDAAAASAVVSGSVAALVSPVPAEEFSASSLAVRLEDVAWVERLARRHFAVAADAFTRGPVLPLRMCTIFESRESVERMLVEHGEDLQAALGHVAGAAEWSVKVLAPVRGPRPEPASPATAESGVAYLDAVRARRESQRLRGQDARVRAAAADERLKAHAAETVHLAAQPREVAGRARGGMVLNAAYLVRDDVIGRFVEALERERRALEADDLRLEVDGPWPPYSFVPDVVRA